LQSGDQYVLYIILWCSYRGARAPRKEHRHMAKFQVQRKHSNVGLFTIPALAYIGLLILFAWQTWGLVNFLFPDDQLLMKMLTLFLYYEISTRFPNEDEFVEQPKNTISPLKLPSPGKDKDEQQHAVPIEELHPTVENTGNGHQPKNLSRPTL